MAGAPETAAILESLNLQRADARERQAAMERQIREEARRLREGLAGDICTLSCHALCNVMLRFDHQAAQLHCETQSHP